jgi:hypothetical protein
MGVYGSALCVAANYSAERSARCMRAAAERARKEENKAGRPPPPGKELQRAGARPENSGLPGRHNIPKGNARE